MKSLPLANNQYNHLRWDRLLLALLVLGLLLPGCAALQDAFNDDQSPLPSPLPADALPTVIHLTAEARRAATASAQPPSPQVELSPTPSQPPPSTPTHTPTITLSPTPVAGQASLDRTIAPPETLAVGATTAAAATLLTPDPTTTPYPEIPNAAIEIRNLGPLSRVTSPIPVYAYLRPGAGGNVRLELFGEDGRLLTRQIRTFTSLAPGAWAVMLLDLEFEIPLTAEAGRLVISVEDEFGRTTALNSVPLILLSIGGSDLTPPVDVLAPVLILEPGRKSLVAGGVLQARGLARPGSDGLLLARLITPQGQEVGLRVFSVGELDTRGFGAFEVEVSYNIEKATPALLVITAGAPGLNDTIHLTSVEVLLSP